MAGPTTRQLATAIGGIGNIFIILTGAIKGTSVGSPEKLSLGKVLCVSEIQI
jgi:hypothetical protein